MSEHVVCVGDAAVTGEFGVIDEDSFIIESAEINATSEKAEMKTGVGRTCKVAYHGFKRTLKFSGMARTASYPKADKDMIGATITISNDPDLAGTYTVDDITNTKASAEWLKLGIDVSDYDFASAE